jgi:hypothetical protein
MDSTSKRSVKSWTHYDCTSRDIFLGEVIQRPTNENGSCWRHPGIGRLQRTPVHFSIPGRQNPGLSPVRSDLPRRVTFSMRIYRTVDRSVSSQYPHNTDRQSSRQFTQNHRVRSGCQRTDAPTGRPHDNGSGRRHRLHRLSGDVSWMAKRGHGTAIRMDRRQFDGPLPFPADNRRSAGAEFGHQLRHLLSRWTEVSSDAARRF